MKHIIIPAILLTALLTVPATALEIRLSTPEPCTLPWIPITLHGEVINNSSSPIEIPAVRPDGIGFGNICRNVMRKTNGESPKEKEFRHTYVMGDYPPGPWQLKTEILQPGEARKFSFSYGAAAQPLELEFWVECQFYQEPADYKKNNLILDHKICAGNYKSNTVIVTVSEPTGIDAEAYASHWKDQASRNNLEDARKNDYRNHLEQFPQSRYSEYLLCRIDPSSSRADFTAKRPVEYVSKALQHQRWESSKIETMHEVQQQLADNMAQMKVLQHFPQSLCRFSKRLSCAEHFINNGSFNWACRILNEILAMTPTRDVDKIISTKAKEYLDALRANGHFK
jgi:hypothetical protein